jgi:hypothetical protein
VNVGVILLAPQQGFIKARMAGGNDRVRRFFGADAGDLESINFMKQALASRIEAEGDQFKSAEDLQRFAEQQANMLTITAPRFVKVFNPEQDLESLFNELIGGRGQRQPSDEVEPVRRLLSRAIRKEGLDGFVRRNVTVKVPAFHTELTVPFAFYNGACNLIQPARFNQSTMTGIRSAACQLAVEGSSLHRRPDEKLGQVQLLVVGAFRKEAEQEEILVRDILRETGVSLYSWQRIAELTKKIRETGKPAPRC